LRASSSYVRTDRAIEIEEEDFFCCWCQNQSCAFSLAAAAVRTPPPQTPPRRANDDSRRTNLAPGTMGKKPSSKAIAKTTKRLSASARVDAEIKELEGIIEETKPTVGENPLAVAPRKSSDKESGMSLVGQRKFAHLPISQATKGALRECRFKEMTAIQRATLPHALCGRDVLGAAKTGSGKTLAYVIPLVEALWRKKWGRQDGVGALIISPTRELAIQIFQCLTKVGARHTMSAGLLIGGKDVQEEANRVNKMNILVCTPGRLLQHMDETPLFDCVSLQVLVLDEADRMLDLGFSKTLNAILANLPKERQTLLFSATQTKSVKDLARLGLKDPEYLSVHAESVHSTPPKLQQMVTTCALEKKIEVLWSFIRTHLTAKTLVFFSSCKQVKFVYEIFKRMRPGVPLQCIHGRLKQARRQGVFYQFCNAKEIVLFATDVASRGLDFPAVDWVVQADCPEDVPTYIHRVGRTARYTAAGKGLLMLTPGESHFMKELEEAKVPLKPIKINPKKQSSRIQSSMQGLLSKDSDLKYLSQRAVVCYLRSVYLQKNKKVFDIKSIDIDAFSFSMGLPNAPRLRFMQTGQGAAASDSDEEEDAPGASDEEEASDEDGASDDEDDEDDDDEDDSEDASESEEEEPTKPKDGIIQRKGGGRFGLVVEQGDDDDDDFMNVKRVDHRLGDDSDSEEDEKKYDADEKAAEIARKRALKGKLKIKESGHGANKRVVFDEEGTSMAPLQALGVKSGVEDVSVPGESLRAAMKARYAEVAAERKEADRADKGREKARLREGRLRKKQKLRNDADEEDGEVEVTLGGASDSDDFPSDSEMEDAPVPRKRDVIDPAVAGMAPVADEKLESLEERALRLLEG
jgi:ATP-dependent RNA helicase DDX10/DBP4